jgi:NhaA family Na+:H+ antiporter
MPGSEPPLRHSWLSSDRPVPRLIARPMRTFLRTEAAGGVVLLAATVLALAWANSPFRAGYESVWATELRLSIGAFEVSEDLRHWVNDALMAIFFFVVGLEIKREVVTGELNEVRKAMLPAVAAVGGMILPASIYLALNAGGEGARGWGIPMATDIAFSVGLLALLSESVPSGLKVFLLTLAIVDDVGVLLAIALFYSGGLGSGWLVAAVVLVAAILALRRVKVFWIPAYVVLGGALWFVTLQSGVHATLAGVVLGLLTPARASDPGGFDDVVVGLAGVAREPDAEAVHAMTLQAKEVVSVAERLEHLLHPWTSYAVVPLFALANAGLELDLDRLGGALGSSVGLGVVAGLVVGKTVGITGASWLAVKLDLGRLPEGVGWGHIVGAAAVAGIGFTVSLFIIGLAFEDPRLVEGAKTGVLVGSLLAGAVGAIALRSVAIRARRRGSTG